MPRGKKKECGFISGLTLDFAWSNEEIYIAEKRLKNGSTIRELSRELNRNILEVYILVDDLIKNGKVEQNKSILRKVC